MSDLAFTSDGAPGGGKNAAIEQPRGLLPHYVSGAPFDPYAVERMTPGARALLSWPRSGG